MIFHQNILSSAFSLCLEGWFLFFGFIFEKPQSSRRDGWCCLWPVSECLLSLAGCYAMALLVYVVVKVGCSEGRTGRIWVSRNMADGLVPFWWCWNAVEILHGVVPRVRSSAAAFIPSQEVSHSGAVPQSHLNPQCVFWNETGIFHLAEAARGKVLVKKKAVGRNHFQCVVNILV